MIDADAFEDSLNVGDIAMTVLDENIMSNSLGGDRYITPEYLAPLPQVINQFSLCMLNMWENYSIIQGLGFPH